MIPFSGLSRFSGHFGGDGPSPLNRDTTVFSHTLSATLGYAGKQMGEIQWNTQPSSDSQDLRFLQIFRFVLKLLIFLIFLNVSLPLLEAWCSVCEFVVGAGEIRLIGASLKLRVSFFWGLLLMLLVDIDDEDTELVGLVEVDECFSVDGRRCTILSLIHIWRCRRRG